jgi:hypothetical protein
METKQIKFYPEFKELILCGDKTSTIRKDKYLGKITKGQKLKLITTAGDFIANAVCMRIEQITLFEDKTIDTGELSVFSIFHSEGFKSWSEFWHWFNSQYGYPFYGVIIFWELDDANT